MKGRVKRTKNLILLVVITLIFSVSLFLAFNQQPLTENMLTIPTQPISPTSTNPKMGTHLQYLVQTSDPSAECEMIIFFEKTVNYTQGINLLKNLGDFEIISNYTILDGICIKAPIRMAETIAQQNYVRSVTYNEQITLAPDQVTTNEIHTKDTVVNTAIGADTLQNPPYNLSGTGVVVAVVDSGINSHIDLPLSRIIYAKNFANDGDENYTADLANHGTAVAGIIGASGINYLSAKGVAPAVKFLNLRVLNSHGTGESDWLLLAINEALNNTSHLKADIISLSLGDSSGTSYDDMSIAVNSAWVNNDTIVVAAAGNEGGDYWYTYYGTINSPGLAAYIITVGSTDNPPNYNSISYFSSRGPTDDSRAKPDIVAPGEGITTLKNDSNSYVSFSGTSASTPVVSGAIALLLDNSTNGMPWLTPNTVKAALMMTAKDLGLNPFSQGAGLINVSRAYNYLQEYYITGTNNTPPLIVTPIRAIAYPMHLWDLTPADLKLTVVVGNVTNPIINASFSTSGNAGAFTTISSGVFSNLSDTQVFVPVSFIIPLWRSVYDFSGNLTLFNGSGDVLFRIPLALNDASFTDWPVSVFLWFSILNDNINSANTSRNLVYLGIGLIAAGVVVTVGIVWAISRIRKPEVLPVWEIPPELQQLSTMFIQYCPYCGTKVEPNDFFCYHCGKQIRIPPYKP